MTSPSRTSRPIPRGRVPVATLALAALAVPLLLSSPAQSATGSATAGAATAHVVARTSVVTDLRVDADRNGTVDLGASAASADERGEEAASPISGALFLPNVDDDGQRCPKTVKVKKPKDPAKHQAAALAADRKLNACNDATDQIVNGPEDAKDLAPIKSLPQAVGDAATGALEVSSDKVNVFVNTADTWQLVTPATRFSAAQLRQGLTLGVEGRDIARDVTKWDGTTQIKLTVSDGARTSSDTVTMRVAPLLAQNNTQTTTQVLIANVPEKGKFYDTLRTFEKDLRKTVTRAGVPDGLRILKGANDTWIQDYLEPMYASIPSATSPTGAQSMRLLLRSDQDFRPSSALYRLRGHDVGVIWMGKPAGGGTLDSMGNFEAAPPYVGQGRSWPAGRVVLGRSAHKKKHDRVSQNTLALLQAQGMQDPIYINTGFLDVAHTDEIVQFVPADNERGWMVAVADPGLALKLVRKAQAAGLGDKPISARISGHYAVSIDKALGSGNTSVVKPNQIGAKAMRENIATLKKELGLSDSDFIHVPVLLQHVDYPTYDPRFNTALLPNSLNNLVLTRDSVLAAKPFATKVKGRDLFADAIEKAYSAAGIKVRWIDEWDALHMGDGDVHCGTNSLRDITAPWWG